jgi:TatD DNase family protein
MIDIGANLTHDSFDADRAQVLERAWQAGVEKIVITGSSRESSAQALVLARSEPGRLYSTAGLHPHHAAAWDDNHASVFRELANHLELVAMGECGLDYFRELAPRDAQRRAFIAQLELAAAARKPVFLHQRDAHDDFLPILREYRPQLPGAVVHCFTDTREALDAYLALDCHIGITGWICDERRGRGLHDLARHIPADRILVETDAPYLLPRTAEPKPRHRRNEPACLPWVVKALAQARGEDPEQVARSTTANAKKLFHLE